MAEEVEKDRFPEYAEILGRKTLETLEHWMKKHESKVITTREFFLVVTALYTTTAGIVPRDVTDVLVRVDKELRSG